jgi:hypothetical protein
LKLLGQQAASGDLVLLYQDASEALTHPYLASVWAKRGADLRVEAPGKAKKVAILGVREAVTGELLIHTSATKRSSNFIALLERLDLFYGPGSCAHPIPVVLVLDNGPIHTSQASTKALAARSSWLTVEWLPKYAPELNALERDWLHLKRCFLANRVFADEVELDQGIHASVRAINAERITKTCV